MQYSNPCFGNHLLDLNIHWRKQRLAATGTDMRCGQIFNIENCPGLNAMQVYGLITIDIDAIQVVKRGGLVHILFLFYLIFEKALTECLHLLK
jgi:hypothetical protein